MIDDFLAVQRARHVWTWQKSDGKPLDIGTPLELSHEDLHYFFDALIHSLYPSEVDGFLIPNDNVSLALEVLKSQLRISLQNIDELKAGQKPFAPNNQIHESNLIIALGLISSHCRPGSKKELNSYTWNVDDLGHDLLMNLDGSSMVFSVVPIGFLDYSGVEFPEDPTDRLGTVFQFAEEYLDLSPPFRDMSVLLYLKEAIAPICERIIANRVIKDVPKATVEFFLQDFVQILDDRMLEIASAHEAEFYEAATEDVNMHDDTETRGANVPFGERRHPSLRNSKSDPSDLNDPEVLELFRRLEEEFRNGN